MKRWMGLIVGVGTLLASASLACESAIAAERDVVPASVAARTADGLSICDPGPPNGCSCEDQPLCIVAPCPCLHWSCDSISPAEACDDYCSRPDWRPCGVVD
jgi:hypothetical protein